MAATKLADISLNKKSGTILTLNTKNKFVDNDVYFTIGTPTAEFSTSQSSADVNVESTDDSSKGGINISGAIGTKVTTEPTSGYYIRIKASASVTPTVTTAGWADTGDLTTSSPNAVKFFPVSAATVTQNAPTVNSSTGLVTATTTTTAGYTPAQATAGSNTLQLSTQAAKTVTPSESVQTAVAAGKYTTGIVKVGAISSTYVGSGIAQNDSDDLTISGKTVTVPAGYYASNASVSISAGTVTSGTASITSLTKTYNTTNDSFDVTGSANVSAPTVNTAGYISSSEGTRSAKTNGATVTATLNKIVGSTAITGDSTKKPSISKVDTPSGVTNAATSGSATTTAPSSGVYVAVKSNANTGTLTATPSVTTEGYGTADNHGITGNTATVGALASDTTYVQIKTTSATVSGKTVSYGSGWIDSGSKSVATGSVTSGSATIDSVTFAYDSQNSRFNATGSASIGAPTVNTEGYVSSSEGTKTGNTASLSANVPTIVGETTITGTTTKKPSITKQNTPSGVTNAASGNATTTAPTSGVYVAVKSAATTGTLTATPSVTSEGYGDTTNHSIAGATATVGASASSVTYVPITTTSATVSGKTVSYGSGWITEGSSSVADGSVTQNAPTVNSSTGVVTATSTVTEGYVSAGTKSNTLNLSTQAGTTITPTESEQTAVSAGKYTTGAVKVGAISSTYVGSGIAQNDSDDLTVSGKTVTAPAGYYAQNASASVAVGTVTSGTATISTITKTYNSTSGKFDIGGSANVSAPTVGTAGYISSSEGTKNAKTNGATVSATIDKIVGATTITTGTGTGTDTATKKPSIGKVATPSGVTNAASGDATTTAPSSGVYVAVKSNANTGKLTATPSVTTAGYGDATNHGLTARTATYGASASDTTYVPITTTTATVSGKTVSYGSGWITEGSKSVADGSVTQNAPTINASTGVVTATSTVTEGYVSADTKSNTLSLSTQAGTTIAPTESVQTAVSAGKYTTGAVKIGAISSTYVGSGIAQNDSDDLTASGATVTAPAGYYAQDATKTIASGSVTQNAPTVNSSGLVTATSTVTAGYVSADTKSNTLQLTTKGAETITPGTTDKTIASGKYLTGTQTIKGDANLVASKIKDGVSIFGVTGTFSDASTVSSGQTAAGASQIRSGYSAFVDGAEVQGSLGNTSVSQGTTTVSGSTATRGTATWGNGVISSGSIGAATFANTATSGVTYVDISNTTDAPVLVSGSSLFINKGYTDNLKISLAKLVPDGASADLASNKILSGYSAYNNDGTLIAGNIASQAAQTITPTTSNQTIAAGKYLSGKQTIKGDANLLAGNIKSGVTIFGVTGTYKGYTAIESDDSHGGKILTITTDEEPYTYSWIGAGAEFVQTLGTVNWTLNDTTYADWTPDTSKATTIKATTNLTTFSADMANYEYVVVWHVKIDYAYNSGTADTAKMNGQYHTLTSALRRQPSNYANLLINNYNGGAVVNYVLGMSDYYNASSARDITYQATYGIYASITSPTFSSTTSNTPTITVKTPTLATRCSTTYFSTACAGAIDKTNTTITMKADLYRISIGNSFSRGMLKDLNDYYNEGSGS